RAADWHAVHAVSGCASGEPFEVPPPALVLGDVRPAATAAAAGTGAVAPAGPVRPVLVVGADRADGGQSWPDPLQHASVAELDGRLPAAPWPEGLLGPPPLLDADGRRRVAAGRGAVHAPKRAGHPAGFFRAAGSGSSVRRGR